MNVIPLLIWAASLPWLGVQAPVAIDPARMKFETAPIPLLRSSAFFTMRTRQGTRLWYTDFPDHHTARLFMTFSWPAHKSRDLESFRQRIRAKARFVAGLGKHHEKVIVVISYTPDWLSTSNNRRQREGHWKVCNACMPRDMAVWRAMVKEIALTMRRVKGAEVYYEFWNEPDLFYWQQSADDFLKLYAETVKILKKVHPTGKVGGAAVNQWRGKFRQDPKRGPVNFELIRYAQQKSLPLDFISWHHFGHPARVAREAREGYDAELRRIGWQRKKPEYLITEWAIAKAYRGSRYSPAMTADLMLGFVDAGVDAQTIACWEDFHKRTEKTGLTGYGLVTQDGIKKPAYHVHMMLDRLSRKTEGIAVLRPTPGRTLVISRKKAGALDIMAWSTVQPTAWAIWFALQQHGWTRDQIRGAFRSQKFRAALRSRAIYRGSRATAINAARAALREASRRHRQLQLWALDFPGTKRLRVASAQVVSAEPEEARVDASGSRLAFLLPPNAVIRIRLTPEP